MHADQSQFEDVNQVAVQDRRMQVRAYNFWYSLLKGRDFPAIDDLKPSDLKAFAANSVLLDFSTGREDPALPYVGAALRVQCGVAEDVTRLSDVPAQSLLGLVAAHYDQLIETRTPVGFESANAEDLPEDLPLYRGILMPFSSDGRTIDYVYAVVNWKSPEQRAAERAAAEEARREAEGEYEDLDAPAPLPEVAAEEAVVEAAEDGPSHDAIEESDDALELADAIVEALEPEPTAAPSDEELASPAGIIAFDPVEPSEEERSVDAMRYAEMASVDVPDDVTDAPEEEEPVRGGAFAALSGKFKKMLNHDPFGGIAIGADGRPVDEDPVAPFVEEEDPQGFDDEPQPDAIVSAPVYPDPDPRMPPAPPEPIDQDVGGHDDTGAPAQDDVIDEFTPVPFATPEDTMAADEPSHFARLEPLVEEASDATSAPDDAGAVSENVAIAEPLDLSAASFMPTDEQVETAEDAAAVDHDGETVDAADWSDAKTTDGDDASEDFVTDLDPDTPDVDESGEPDAPARDAMAEWLETARASAALSKDADSRSRAALYQALGEAYDFSLAAAEAPEDYAALLEAADLTVQARAPMTPIVKLVFGLDYDKTRLTEFASALSYGHRMGVSRGDFEAFVAEADGGLKGLVAEERRFKRGEEAQVSRSPSSRLEKAFRALRRRDAIDLAHLGANEEFSLVLVRRDESGGHSPVARVLDDRLIERAILKSLD